MAGEATAGRSSGPGSARREATLLPSLEPCSGLFSKYTWLLRVGARLVGS